MHTLVCVLLASVILSNDQVMPPSLNFVSIFYVADSHFQSHIHRLMAFSAFKA